MWFFRKTLFPKAAFRFRTCPLNIELLILLMLPALTSSAAHTKSKTGVNTKLELDDSLQKQITDDLNKIAGSVAVPMTELTMRMIYGVKPERELAELSMVVVMITDSKGATKNLSDLVRERDAKTLAQLIFEQKAIEMENVSMFMQRYINTQKSKRRWLSDIHRK